MTTAVLKNDPLIEVRLYGHLRAKFGKSYHVAVRSAGEAVRFLSAVVPGFKAHLIKHSSPGYRIWLGNDPIQKNEELGYPGGKLIRIVPVTAGSKSGFGSIILGAALIGASFYVPGLSAAVSSIAFSTGVSLALGGAAQLLAGNPETAAPAEQPGNLPSYAFNGAVNTTGQGNAVSILYGRLEIGSQVISSGLLSRSLIPEQQLPLKHLQM